MGGGCYRPPQVGRSRHWPVVNIHCFAPACLGLPFSTRALLAIACTVLRVHFNPMHTSVPPAGSPAAIMAAVEQSRTAARLLPAVVTVNFTQSSIYPGFGNGKMGGYRSEETDYW